MHTKVGIHCAVKNKHLDSHRVESSTRFRGNNKLSPYSSSLHLSFGEIFDFLQAETFVEVDAIAVQTLVVEDGNRIGETERSNFEIERTETASGNIRIFIPRDVGRCQHVARIAFLHVR